MGQVSAKLRRTRQGFAHWCPGCEQPHVIFDSWQFDGNLEAPTFNPSIKITGKKTIWKDGKWNGEWARDAQGNTLDDCCHYFLHAGALKFCGDSLHGLAGKNMPLPDLPEHMRDPEWVYD
jgi:hypothetical protein